MRRSVKRRRLARWGGLFATVVLALVYLANLPLYAGSSLGPFISWRMEHGRLALERHAAQNPEAFYVAINSEGMRFAPECRVFSWRDWRVNVPLWLPLLLAVAVTSRAWTRWIRRPRDPSRCPACRYPRAGLAFTIPCPECGNPPPPPPPAATPPYEG
jgi:hypothetical protein